MICCAASLTSSWLRLRDAVAYARARWGRAETRPQRDDSAGILSFALARNVQSRQKRFSQSRNEHASQLLYANRALEESYPHLRRRAIFLTGDTFSPETREFLERVGVARLNKPFRAAEVRQIVYQVLQTP